MTWKPKSWRRTDRMMNWQGYGKSESETTDVVRTFFRCQNRLVGWEIFMASQASICRQTWYGTLVASGLSGARRARWMEFCWWSQEESRCIHVSTAPGTHTRSGDGESTCRTHQENEPQPCIDLLSASEDMVASRTTRTIAIIISQDEYEHHKMNMNVTRRIWPQLHWIPNTRTSLHYCM